MLNENLASIMRQQYFANSLIAYAVALLTFVGLLILAWIFKNIVVSILKRIAQKTISDFDDFLVSLFEKIESFFYIFIAFYLAANTLLLSLKVGRVLNTLLVAVLVYKTIRVAQDIIAFSLEKFYFRAGEKDEKSAASLKSILVVINWILWATGGVFVLDNMGLHISTLVAGLGIGGVAIALAAQTVLGDLFSSFAILIDKPFKVGDFIIIGDYLGAVEHIGIKTTRIRSLSGELLVFSNSDLTNSRIRNYRLMEKRRVVFKFGVIYQTTLEQLKSIPPMISEIVDNIDRASLDRAHFFSYGNSSLDFEVVYYIQGNDYNLYMDIQQEINLKIFEKFKEKGIEFAYPTQTLYMTNR
ncbi:MAG: mechanosensitive ion channel family protein [Candidatus Margulisiibacteriota bacterium]|nr:mechanosensitive ion channel family protein [Candidatus Margulisiibacteriota bacterium]